MVCTVLSVSAFFVFSGYLCRIKSRLAFAKAALNKKKTHFASKLDLNLKKKLVKCYIWNIDFYGAGTWTLRKIDRKYL